MSVKTDVLWGEAAAVGEGKEQWKGVPRRRGPTERLQHGGVETLYVERLATSCKWPSASVLQAPIFVAQKAVICAPHLLVYHACDVAATKQCGAVPTSVEAEVDGSLGARSAWLLLFVAHIRTYAFAVGAAGSKANGIDICAAARALFQRLEGAFVVPFTKLRRVQEKHVRLRIFKVRTSGPAVRTACRPCSLLDSRMNKEMHGPSPSSLFSSSSASLILALPLA